MKNTITIAATGHRPNKLPGGYDVQSYSNVALGKKIRDVFLSHLDKGLQIHAISGMALGVDTIFALVALNLKDQGYAITVEAAIPCKNHPCRWPQASQRQWKNIVDRCDKVTYVSDQEYTPACMQRRNIYMVDNCNKLIAVWDGTPGGTGSCVNYARKKGSTITHIDPTTNEFVGNDSVELTNSHLTYVKGNLLESDCNVIFHQANCFSTMGTGIAKHIKDKYPEAYLADKTHKWTSSQKLGKYTSAYSTTDDRRIVNLYGQFNYGRETRHTDYRALENALNSFFESNEIPYNPKFGFPYMMGCVNAGGDWAIVSEILERIATKHDVTLNIYQL